MEHKRPESVLVVVYTQEGEVLMLRRKYPGNFWQSITGSLELDEKPIDAAKRELREETGICDQQINDCHQSQTFEIYSIWRDRYAPGVTHNLEHVFTVQLPGRVAIQLNPNEHEEYMWLPRQQAIDIAFSFTNQDAIKRWVP